ncbi:hypothetical protein [Paraglaciecola sp.]|uniref:hypothetical protein n=1 Tax=Paraglaciecola sp. TaxID=1920173 RepID=UPI003EF5F301
MQLRKVLFLVFAISFYPNYVSAEKVVFGGLEGDPYFINLLSHTLSYSPDKKYKVEAFSLDVPKPRIFKMLEDDDGVHVLTGSATAKRESQYRAVYFPILKGVKGWRVPIISAKKPKIFSDVDNLNRFKSFVPVQFNTWISTKIFEFNEIEVAKGSNYKGLYLMLDKGRVDYLPRSILDVKRDLNIYPELDLMLDPNILIKYPSAYYFYVNKGNEMLAKDIKRGLELSLSDGSFDRLFNKAFGSSLRFVGVHNRKVIQLNSPYKLKSMPLERSELWEISRTN